MSMWKGKTNNYYWKVSESSYGFSNLLEAVLKFHAGKCLHITSFDSGPITPNEEEDKLGWHLQNEVMVSPPLHKGMLGPYEQYDEWYISDSELIFTDEFEIFVNYGGFNLVSPKDITKDDDPTWERGRMDFLYPLQERFWAQLNELDPESYIAIGDNDIVVSKNEQFINHVTEHA